MSFSSFNPFNVMILDLDRNSQSLSIQARSSKASPSLPFSVLPQLLSLSEPLRSHQSGSFPLKGFCRSYLSVCKLHPSTPSFCLEVSAHSLGLWLATSSERPSQPSKLKLHPVFFHDNSSQFMVNFWVCFITVSLLWNTSQGKSGSVLFSILHQVPRVLMGRSSIFIEQNEWMGRWMGGWLVVFKRISLELPTF